LDGIAAGATAYSDTNVDTHLNTSTASANEVLSWTGTDYDWVAQSGGGVSEINDLSDALTNSSGQTIGIGTGALANDDGSTNQNTAVGYQAANTLTTAASNSAFGWQALYNANSSLNAAFGIYSLRAATSGQRNTACGAYAGYATTIGSNNTFVGYLAGGTHTTGSNNTCIGNGAYPSSNTVNNEITLGSTNVTSFRIPGLQSSASNGDVLTYNSTTGVIELAAPAGGGGGGDAATLDTLDSTQFLRSDAADIKTSGNLTFNDNVRAEFGTDADAYIYHNNTNLIFDNLVGDFFIRNLSDDKDIVIRTDNGSGSIVDYIRCDGSTGEVILSHYGTERLATKSYGALITGSYTGNITAVSALAIDCSTANYFTKTISANSTFTFSNVPASVAYSFTLELTHTSGTVTWPTTVKWPGDTAPTLTTGKTHLFMFVTDDGGTRWRGAYLVDYTN